MKASGMVILSHILVFTSNPLSDFLIVFTTRDISVLVVSGKSFMYPAFDS